MKKMIQNHNMPAREGKTKEKIKSDINTPEQYKYYLKENCENKDSLFYITKHEYTEFLKLFFNEFMEELLFDNTQIQLPYHTGMVSIRKYDQKITIKDGKIISNLPVDWNSTLKLWDSDEQAKEDKKLVKFLNKNRTIYKFVYLKSQAKFKNKYFYWFKPTRTNKQKLAGAIKQNKINVYNLF